MALEIIRPTQLRAEPAPSAMILRPLFTGTIVQAVGKKQGDWVRVTFITHDGDAELGWVRANDCREVPDRPGAELDVSSFVEACYSAERLFSYATWLRPWKVSADFLIARALIETDLKNTGPIAESDALGPLQVSSAEWDAFLNDAGELASDVSPADRNNLASQVMGAAWRMHADSKAISDLMSASRPGIAPDAFIPSYLDDFHAYLLNSPKAAVVLADAQQSEIGKRKNVADVLREAMRDEDIASLFATRADYLGTAAQPKTVGEFVATTETKLDRALRNAFELIQRHSPVSELDARRREAVVVPVGDMPPGKFSADIDLWVDSGRSDARKPLREIFKDSANLDALESAPDLPGTAPEAPASGPRTDIVDISVFGPDALKAGGSCLIQVFLHALNQAAEVIGRAKESDPEAQRRALKTLATEIARGQRIEVLFLGGGLTSEAAKQDLVWRGDPAACQFVVSAPANTAGQTFFPSIQILLNSVPIGSVAFKLPVTADEPHAAPSGIRGERAQRYRYAFLSYASGNRAEVLKRAQGLRAAGLDFFQDLLTLEPGEQWEKKLYEEIDRCDLFLLFWSSQAKLSPWVLKETAYALTRQKSSGEQLPHIVPVIIEGPPPPSPPDDLKDIHFNDSLIYVLAAVEATAVKPKPG
jgi:hypothetical protein